MLNRLARYQPIVQFLERHPNASVLEVGSGSLGLGEFIDRAFVGCDLQFNGSKSPGMQPVAASALALPFRDNDFDIVVCSDVIEHLAIPDRDVAWGELLRVARRYIIVGFPCGQLAQFFDTLLFQWYKYSYRPTPEWLVEHTEAPFPPCRFSAHSAAITVKLATIGTENLVFHLLLMIMESYPKGCQFSSWLSGAGQRWGKIILTLTRFPPFYRQINIYVKRVDTG